MHYTLKKLWSDEGGFWGIAAPYIIGGIQAGIGYLASRNASNAAKDAAEIQSDAASKAVDLQAAIYAQQRADQAPWLHYGNEALSTMGSLMGLGGFTGAQVSSPGLNLGGGGTGDGGGAQIPFDPGKGTDVPGPGDQGFGWSPGDPSGNVNDGYAIPYPNGKQMGPGIDVQMPNGETISIQLNELPDAIRLGGVVVPPPNAVPIGSFGEPEITQVPPSAEMMAGGGTGRVGDIPAGYQQYQ